MQVGGKEGTEKHFLPLQLSEIPVQEPDSFPASGPLRALQSDGHPAELAGRRQRSPTHRARPPDPAAPPAEERLAGQGEAGGSQQGAAPRSHPAPQASSLWAAAGTTRGASPSAAEPVWQFHLVCCFLHRLIPALEMPGLVSTPPLVQLHSKLEQGAERRQKIRSKARHTRSRLVSQSHSARGHEKTIVLAQFREERMGGNRQRARGCSHSAVPALFELRRKELRTQRPPPAPNPDVIVLQHHTPRF